MEISSADEMADLLRDAQQEIEESNRLTGPSSEDWASEISNRIFSFTPPPKHRNKLSLFLDKLFAM